MALQDVYNAINFTTTQVAAVQQLIATLYNGSATARVMLDKLVVDTAAGLRRLEISFEAGAEPRNESNLNGIDDRIVWDTFNPTVSGTLTVDSNGNAVNFTNEFLLAHELAHAIYNISDDGDSPSQNATTPIRPDFYSNQIHNELTGLGTDPFGQPTGYQLRVSYNGTFTNAEVGAIAGINNTTQFVQSIYPGDSIQWVEKLFAGSVQQPTNLDTLVVDLSSGSGVQNAGRFILTGSGDDYIYGYGGGDNIQSGAGNDVIFGGSEDDFINGGSGIDRIYGGLGADTIDGGDGSFDTYVDENDGLAVDTLSNIESIISQGDGSYEFASNFFDDLFGGLFAPSTKSPADKSLVASNTVIRGPEGLSNAVRDGLATLNVDEFGDFSITVVSTGETVLSISDFNWADGNIFLDTGREDISVLGSVGDDTLTGTSGADLIVGAAGDDTMFGGSGDDELSGEGGDDVLWGQGGADDLYGDRGSDTLNGGAGNDRLWGGAENDVLVGGTGNDQLSGGVGDDTLTGGDGGDVLNGGAGIDTAVYTNSGNRVIINLGSGTATSGEATGDVLNSIENVIGSAFGDSLSGSDGDNVLSGGSGNDVLRGYEGADVLDGGAGTDTADYRASNAAVTVDLATNTGQGGHAEGDTLIGIERAYGSSFADVLSGDAGNNLFYGYDGNDTLNGLGGNDFLRGFEGSDTLNGGDGNDVLRGNAGADTLNGGAGTDTADYRDSASGVAVNLASGTGSSGDAAGDILIDMERVYGSNFNDVLSGDAGSNLIRGYGGNDFLRGFEGNDRLEGGDGTDVLRGNEGADTLNGGAGTDTADYRDSASAVVVNLTSGTGSSGDAEGDILIDIERAYGSSFGDVLIGDTGNNLFYGYGGNDTLNGFGGNDFLRGFEGNDTLNGGDGNDVLRGNEGADTINGGAGTDTADYRDSASAVVVNLTTGTGSSGDAAGDVLIDIERAYGSSSDDVLTGDNANNLFYGYDGDDVLNGLGGNDFLRGFEGNDTLNGGDGNDVLRGNAGADTINGGAGTDTADYRDSASAVVVNLTTGTGSSGDAAGDVLIDIERAYGSSSDDVLTGDNANNLFYGYDGDDVLNGLGGNDFLNGGAGLDQFIFDLNSGRDRIGDFTAGEDKIDLTSYGFSSFDQIESLMSSKNGYVMIELSETDSIRLDGLQIDDLSQFDFIF